MLVTFECKAYANITYFGDIAKQLLSMMGQSGTIPSAILADDVPKALAKLQQALAKHAGAKSAVANKDEDNQKETPVQITTRAQPLIELLNAAIKKKCDVMWH